MKKYYVDINIGGQRWLWLKAVFFGHVRLLTDEKHVHLKEDHELISDAELKELVNEKECEEK